MPSPVSVAFSSDPFKERYAEYAPTGDDADKWADVLSTAQALWNDVCSESRVPPGADRKAIEADLFELLDDLADRYDAGELSLEDAEAAVEALRSDIYDASPAGSRAFYDAANIAFGLPYSAGHFAKFRDAVTRAFD